MPNYPPSLLSLLFISTLTLARPCFSNWELLFFYVCGFSVREDDKEYSHLF